LIGRDLLSFLVFVESSRDRSPLAHFNPQHWLFCRIVFPLSPRRGEVWLSCENAPPHTPAPATPEVSDESIGVGREPPVTEIGDIQSHFEICMLYEQQRGDRNTKLRAQKARALCTRVFQRWTLVQMNSKIQRTQKPRK
jgi:hypothetical protein